MKKSTEISLIVGGVILLIVIGVIIYFTAFNKSTTPPTPPTPPTPYWYCPGHPEIDHQCMSCSSVGSLWSGPYDTKEECMNKSKSGDGQCVQYSPGDCDNPNNIPQYDMVFKTSGCSPSSMNNSWYQDGDKYYTVNQKYVMTPSGDGYNICNNVDGSNTKQCGTYNRSAYIKSSGGKPMSGNHVLQWTGHGTDGKQGGFCTLTYI